MRRKLNQVMNIGERLTQPTVWLVMSLLLLVFPIMSAAQAVSGVTGVITDTAGAVVPGVEVKLTDTKTSRELTIKANDDGVYTFSNVSPGVGYTLTFTSPGFQAYVINNVQLGIGKTETQNAQLTAGQVTEVVQVTSTSGDATLNTTDASIGNVIGRRQLRELPIQLRGSPASLIGLQPGAVGDNVGAGGGNRTGSVTGSRADQGNITVDGIDANNPLTGQAFVTVANAPVDSVQEFRAVTSGPNSSEGRSSGGQIQLTTNSGTNDYHGSLREYYRTEQTAANSFFNNRNRVVRPKLRRHQYGGSLGGPLPFFNFGEGNGPTFNSGRDKLFFFFDYEARRDRSQVTASRTVPLQNFREGRIGYINNNPGCTLSSRRDTTPNCISELSAAQVAALDPRGIGVNAALLSFIAGRYPQANDLTGGDGINTGLFRFNAPNIRNDKIYTSRIDANPTQTQKIFARLTVTRRDSTNSVQQFPGDENAVTLFDKSFAIAGGHTWVINPSITNVATVGLSKLNFLFLPPSQLPSFPNSFGAGGILDTAYPSLSSQLQIAYTPTFRDDITWNRGSHSFQFGASYKPIRQKPSLTNDFNFVTLGLGGGLPQLSATQRPSNLLASTTARSRYDSAFAYLLGRYAQVQTNFNFDAQGNPLPSGTGNSRSYQYNEYEFYGQDNWRIRSDLTLNLGLRYHIYPAPYERNGAQSGNDVDFEDLFAIRQQNAADGVAGLGSEPLLRFNLIGKANDGRPFYPTQKDLFAPRLGFAYNPSFEGGILGSLFGNRKTVIRANASKVYDRVGGGITFLINQNSYIFDNTRTTVLGSSNATTSLLNDPRFTSLTATPVVNAPPTITRPFTPFVNAAGTPTGLATGNSTYTIAQNFKIPYSYTYSLGMQREIPGNMLLEVSYVGRLGRRLFTQSDGNQVLNFKDAGSGQFLFDAFNAVQAQLQAGVAPSAVSNQPWIENQFNAALGAGTCSAAFSCTQFAAANFTNFLIIGDTTSVIQGLYQNGFIRPNVGMSAQFASNRVVTNQGKSEYNGLLVSLQKRLSKGLEFELNYTYSHSIDNQSSIANTVSGGLICDVINTNSCRGDSDFDIRHLFNANYIYDLPFGRGRAFGGDMPKWLDAFVGGFTLSGIVNIRSGLAISSASNAFPVSFLVNNPAIINGPQSAFKIRIHDEGGGVQFFDNPATVQDALRYPHHGESGARNTFRSPSYASVDMGLAKKFRMPWSESHLITVRADAFNVFNNNSFSVPNLAYGSTSFGRITGSLSAPRELQFAIRYDF